MPQLHVLDGPARAAGVYPLTPGVSTLGRDPSNDLVLDHPTVSRFQARLLIEDGRAVIEDCGSRHGTFVGGVRIVRPTRLSDGTRFRVGTQDLIYVAEASDATRSLTLPTLPSVLPSPVGAVPSVPTRTSRPATLAVGPAASPVSASGKRTVDCRWRLWWRFGFDAISLGWQVQRSDLAGDPTPRPEAVTARPAEFSSVGKLSPG